MRSARLEIGGITKEIPTVREFPSPAEIVTRIVRLPRLPGLQRQDAIHLPAFQQLSPRFDIGERIGRRKSETVPDVKIAGAVFAIGIEAVFRQVLVPVVGLIIERVGVRIAYDNIQPMVIAARESSLQTVVI